MSIRLLSWGEVLGGLVAEVVHAAVFCSLDRRARASCGIGAVHERAIGERCGERREAEHRNRSAAQLRAREVQTAGCCDKYIGMAVFASQMSLNENAALRKFMLDQHLPQDTRSNSYSEYDRIGRSRRPSHLLK